jgi:hypothetical protein
MMLSFGSGQAITRLWSIGLHHAWETLILITTERESRLAFLTLWGPFLRKYRHSLSRNLAFTADIETRAGEERLGICREFLKAPCLIAALLI